VAPKTILQVGSGTSQQEKSYHPTFPSEEKVCERICFQQNGQHYRKYLRFLCDNVFSSDLRVPSKYMQVKDFIQREIEPHFEMVFKTLDQQVSVSCMFEFKGLGLIIIHTVMCFFHL